MLQASRAGLWAFASLIVVGHAVASRTLFGPSLSTSLPPRPNHTDTAKMARWLAHVNDWGSLATTSIHLKGTAFANTVSFSDGPLSKSTGRLLFYLTAMDATAQDAAINPNVTLSIAEAQLPGSCGTTDPEDPTCAKVSFAGALLPVKEQYLDDARQLMFQRHPQMEHWPASHHFAIYELHIRAIELLDFYGGVAHVAVSEYFAASVGPDSTADCYHCDA